MRYHTPTIKNVTEMKNLHNFVGHHENWRNGVSGKNGGEESQENGKRNGGNNDNGRADQRSVLLSFLKLMDIGVSQTISIVKKIVIVGTSAQRNFT